MDDDEIQARMAATMYPPPSGRMAEVLELLSRGYLNREIAAELRISIYTVKMHLSAIYERLGARNERHVVRRAYEVGWLRLDQLPINSDPKAAFGLLGDLQKAVRTVVLNHFNSLTTPSPSDVVYETGY